MKIRSGFVSNSSSSSFIVRRSEILSKNLLTTPEQDAALQKYGFRKVLGFDPDSVPNMCDKKAWKKEEASVEEHKDHIIFNYGYEVTCNQDEVIMFLVENEIPFVASVHYGHYTWIYTPELDRIIVATNVGKIMSTYGDVRSWNTSKDVETWSASEWLEKEKKIWGNLENQEKE